MARRSGFTLLEMLIVIAIIVVLAGILMPVIAMAKKAMHNAKAQTTLNSISAALNGYKSANGLYPESFNNGLGAPDPYSTAFGATVPLNASAISEASWQTINAALKIQLQSIDPDTFRTNTAVPGSQWITDPWGSVSKPNSPWVFRYRPARYYPLPQGVTTGVPAIDGANPPNLNSYQLWSAGADNVDEFGELLWNGRPGDDVINWSNK